MSGQLLNLPTNIPWKQIAVSEDMMDEKFCNKLFPFAWRSSMAISAYEPDPADLPEELCGDRITYLKITTSITGYQPSADETKRLNDNLEEGLIRSFPDIPTEDLNDALERITNEYFACYGVHLNVAVFPYPNTKKELIERLRIDFSQLKQPNAQGFLEPGETLANPYEHSSGVSFKASDQEQNQLVNIITQGNGTDAELNLHKKMIISIPATAGLSAIEAKVTYSNVAGVKMEAFRTGQSVGTKSTESETGQVHTLLIEADDIDTVVITAPENEASLLEFAYFLAKDVPLTLNDYPHIIDFEPKTRDLYQAATESGEILTGSKSGIVTNKTLTHTENTESSLNLAVTNIPGATGGFGGSATGSITNTETDQDKWSVQTDASRERRETQGTTTQISQMYNLLTGYHAGTNRATFLMLARPHVLQPTDFRTFVQGLRAIEGMQEYFLIVSRPKDVEGLCIEASLETGHFPEDVTIEEPPEEYHESSETFSVEAHADSRLYYYGKCEEFSKSYTIDDDDGKWVIDRRESRKQKENEQEYSGWDDGHAGIAQIEIGDNHQARISLSNYEYRTTENGITVEVSGKICGADFSLTNNADFKRKFKVFTRSVKPKISYEQPAADLGKLLITNRGLCTCFKSGECLEIVSPPQEPPPYVESIVDEPVLKMNKALLTREAISQTRLPAMKEFLQKMQTALTTSFRSPKRYVFGEVGLLESDYFKDQIKQLLPKQYLKSPISREKGLPREVVKALGDDLTIEQALSIDLARFARKTGLNIEEASKARHILLGISQKGDSDKSNSGSEQIS